MLKRQYCEEKIDEINHKLTYIQDEEGREHLKRLQRFYQKEYEKALNRVEPEVCNIRSIYSYHDPRLG